MSDEPDVIWHNTVDGGTWDCKVVRDAPYHGVLTVTRVLTDEVILSEGVGLSYGSIFGPDVDDVRTWENKSITAIDAVAGGSVTEPEGNDS